MNVVPESSTLSERLAVSLRKTADAFAHGDQVAPCAILWPDPHQSWQAVISELQSILPELFLMGDYAPQRRTGPALWLRCIEARLVEGAPPRGTVPIFYLPGISSDTLRAADECPRDLTALVELQYRGAVWLNANRKEWTPFSYLISVNGGLGLDVAKDQQTLEALAGSLQKLISEPLPQLHGRRLDADFFYGLLAPDAEGSLLRWLSEPDAFKHHRSLAEWSAFRQQCKTDFRFDPASDGPLKAAKLLAERGTVWAHVWQRFAEAPKIYPGVVGWLERAAPKAPTMFESAEVWPNVNKMREEELERGLASLADLPHDQVISGVAKLEADHGARREYPWQKLGLSPLATALAPLAQLARLCETVPGAASPEKYAELYANEGWNVDAAAIATLAACGSPEQHAVVLKAVSSVYLPWLDMTARHLQQLIRDNGQPVTRRVKQIEPIAGRILLFADGLRMDIGRNLAEQLAMTSVECKFDWEWSTVPSVTASAKPAASPIANAVYGGEVTDEFSTRVTATAQLLTQDRFVNALKSSGWQYLRSDETGDSTGSAWTEGGALDKRGHSEGWKLARSIETEVRDLVSRVGSLLRAGWTEVIIVTDHGWLLMPGGLPKVELKSFLAENRWGRCAALKSDAQTSAVTLEWSWNPSVAIASPPGAGCFRASMEYSHGGVSLQEMVTPVIRVTASRETTLSAKLSEAKWTGAKCRVIVSGNGAGTRVDIRTNQSDPSTSLLADKHARETTGDGKVTIFLENDSDIGQKAEIILLDGSDRVIDTLSTTLGEQA